MKYQIVIPWRDMGCKYRRKHLRFCYKYYSEKFDVIISGHDPSQDFNVSVARNIGVKKITKKIATVIDADSFIPHSQLFDAIEEAKSGSLAKPFNNYGYLTKQSTIDFYKNFYKKDKFMPEYINSPSSNFCGAAWVIKKETWMDVGGMDESFVGWGSEDNAFHLTCKKLSIPIVFCEGDGYDLFHPSYRDTPQQNIERLKEKYL